MRGVGGALVTVLWLCLNAKLARETIRSWGNGGVGYSYGRDPLLPFLGGNRSMFRP